MAFLSPSFINSSISNTVKADRLRFQFRKRLREVLLFYPEAHGHVKDEGTHLMLTPCQLHLPGPDAMPRLL